MRFDLNQDTTVSKEVLQEAEGGCSRYHRASEQKHKLLKPLVGVSATSHGSAVQTDGTGRPDHDQKNEPGVTCDRDAAMNWTLFARKLAAAIRISTSKGIGLK